MNRILKEEEKDDPKTRRTKKNLFNIVERVRKVVERQQNEQFLAVIGRGEVGDRYFQMNDKQKQETRKKFFNCSLSENGNKGSELKACNVNEYSANNIANLSITPEKSEIISVPFMILKEMFDDASNLIQSHSSIVKAPIMPNTTTTPNTEINEELWFAASKNCPNKPHSLCVAAKTAKVTCDSSCVAWARYRICSHTLAVSEKRGSLRQYLQWFRKNRKTGSITNMADVGMPKSSGQKKKATQKRKGRANIPTAEVQTSLPAQTRWSFPSNELQSPVHVPSSGNCSANTTSNIANSSVTSINNYQPALSTQTSAGQHGLPVYPLPCFRPPQIPQIPTFTLFDAYSPTSTKPDPHPGSFEVTLIHLCDPRVSTCHGCGQRIRTPGMLLPPPTDVVVVTKMRRDYIVAGGEKRQGKLGNVYFHTNLSCIRAKQANFMLNIVFVQPHVRHMLTPLHKQHLLTSIGFSV
jgi:hypothetical protein